MAKEAVCLSTAPEHQTHFTSRNSLSCARLQKLLIAAVFLELIHCVIKPAKHQIIFVLKTMIDDVDNSFLMSFSDHAVIC